jgi:hypothetical protein
MQAADAPEGAAVFGFGVSGSGEGAVVSLVGRAEVADGYQAADVRLNIKFVF